MKTLTAADVQPSGDVLAAMNQIQAAMTAHRDWAAARQRLEPDRVANQKKLDQLAKARADLLVESAMQTVPDRVKEYRSQLDAIDAEQVTVARDLEAIEAAQQALQNRINDAEARLFEMNQSPIVYIVKGHSTAVKQVLQRRLEEVIEQHVLPLALEIAAMNEATSAFRDFEEVFLVPNMTGGVATPLLSGTRSFVGGRHTLLRGEWRKHPELVAAYDAASAPRLLLSRLQTAASRIGERLDKHPGPSKSKTWV